ncbi:MAG: hypothetical protein EF812_04345 [Methanosarcinales archaeon]|nr:MAG: hypothetical protein EF812_04345 [Methanosarcinales archaeon]
MNSSNKTHDLWNYRKIVTEEDIKQLLGDEKINVPSRIQLLTPAVATDLKDHARSGDRGVVSYMSLVDNADTKKTEYSYSKYIENKSEIMKDIGVWKPVIPNMEILPRFSWFLQFKFILEKSMTSKDDEIFYIIDNPVCKEKIFKVPMYPASSWKGRLRWVASKNWIEHDGSAEGRLRLSLLFGDETGEEGGRGLSVYLDNAHNESKAQYRKMLKQVFGIGSNEDMPHHAGKLYFYPTFFNRIGLEVINPHDRKTRAGTKPIYFECVPMGADGHFSLLFVPRDNSDYSVIGVIQDIRFTLKALSDMFLLYGFGAKTSSGFGVAKPDLTEGNIILKAVGIEANQKEIEKPQPPEEVYEKYLNENGSVKEEFRGSGKAGLLSSPEYHEKGNQLGGGGFKEFGRFKQWYVKSSERWQKHLKSKDAPAPEWPNWTFSSFKELAELAEQIEKSLNPQEGPR